MLTAANLAIQFGAKPLFENVSIKFGDGNRYGLIGANGCGKSTLMKILGGDLEASNGNVAIDQGERLGKLRQDQFEYEEQRVLDVVLMGHAELWETKNERDAIYANPDASEEDYVRAARPRGAFLGIGRLYGGGARGRTVAGAGNTHGTARGTDERGGAGLEAACAARAGAVRQSGHPAARRADQPPRHQHHPLARRRDQRAQLDDGDHFPRPPFPEQRVHAHGGPGLRHAARLSGQLRRLHDRVHAGARAAAGREQQSQGSHRRTAGVRAPVLGQQGALEAGDVAHQDDREAEA